tara:strand:- start:55 stop:474 length:420 start_codon:yes stop_codon:yes gene_type:complete
MEVRLNKKLSGLCPPDDWTNPKRHISALTKGGKVIAYGESSLGGASKFSPNRGKSCHSEIAVLKQLGTEDRRKMSKYTIWNIRWSRDGRVVSSKPCINCQRVLMECGVKTIVFSTQDGKFIKDRLENLVCKPSSGGIFE